MRTCVLWDQIGMSAQSIAGAFDLDHDSVVKKSVQQGRRYHGIPEDLAPFGKAAIGREYHGAFFVPLIDELEDEIGATGRDRQIADLVDDQQAISSEEA